MLAPPDTCAPWVVLVPERCSGDPVWQSPVTPSPGPAIRGMPANGGLPRPWLTASTETFRGEQDYFHTSLLNDKAQVTAGEPRDVLFTWAFRQGACAQTECGVCVHSQPLRVLDEAGYGALRYESFGGVGKRGRRMGSEHVFIPHARCLRGCCSVLPSHI